MQKVDIRFHLLWALLLISSSCSTHQPHRADDPLDPNCVSAPGLIETNLAGTDASIAFIEFTERGNLANRACVQRVYDHIQQEIDSAGSSGVAVLTYIHGWKHNASVGDTNVTDFINVLTGIERGDESFLAPAQMQFPFQYKQSSAGASTKLKVIGVYIGWRGAVFAPPTPDFIENITFWDRKTVAEGIGKGGVTEVMLTLNRLVNCESLVLGAPCEEEHGNVFIGIGHSFGAGILLAAMNEIILDRILAAESKGECVETRRFNDGLILLNPAIEANQLLQVMERIAPTCFTNQQDVLMHVLSSSGDNPTHRFFPFGQHIRSLFFNWKRLIRADAIQREPREIRERDLFTQTIGNTPQFWSGLLQRGRDNRWQYTRLSGDAAPRDLSGELISNHIYVPWNSPVQLVYTDANFMKNHNDIFNPQVVAYISAVATESLALVRGLPVKAECLAGSGSHSFSFQKCFAHYLGSSDPEE